MNTSVPLQPVIAFIGLGSNLNVPIEQIKSARTAISSLPGVKELAFSKLYQSSPMGPQNQPDYVNAVMMIFTDSSPLDLLHKLQNIEHEHGRIRGDQRWGARTLDLDLLLYGDQQIDMPELTVPHPGMTSRTFVLYPLRDCAADLVIPGKGNLADVLSHCEPLGLRLLSDYE